METRSGALEVLVSPGRLEVSENDVGVDQVARHLGCR